MSHPRNRAERQHYKYHHGKRRIQVDRAEHGTPFTMRYTWRRTDKTRTIAGRTYRISERDGCSLEPSCECWEPDALAGRGRFFNRLADGTYFPKDRDGDYSAPRSAKRAPTLDEWD